MAINLIIKGSFDDAINAASSRGIILRQLQSTGHGETLAITGDRNLVVVIEWFNADFAPIKLGESLGYAAGSLLHYSQPEARSHMALYVGDEDQFSDDDFATDPVADQPDLSADMIDG